MLENSFVAGDEQSMLERECEESMKIIELP